LVEVATLPWESTAIHRLLVGQDTPVNRVPAMPGAWWSTSTGNAQVSGPAGGLGVGRGLGLGLGLGLVSGLGVGLVSGLGAAEGVALGPVADAGERPLVEPHATAISSMKRARRRTTALTYAGTK
jgi:hypothetical protein